MVATSPTATPSMSVTSIMVTSIETMPTMGASLPRTSRHTAQMDDFAPQAHHRLERQEPLRFLAPFHGIVAGMVAIQNRPGPHHVRPGLWTRDDGGAIGEMDQAWIDSQSAQLVECRVEALLLFPRLLPGGGVGENFRRREVGKDAGESEVP